MLLHWSRSEPGRLLLRHWRPLRVCQGQLDSAFIEAVLALSQSLASQSQVRYVDHFLLRLQKQFQRRFVFHSWRICIRAF